MQCSPGDTIVHPRHGVATVRAIDAGGPDGSDPHVELFFDERRMTIKVPMASLDAVGIRPLPTLAEATAILDLLAEPSDVPTDWSERNAATQLRLRSTELAQASMVIRDLTRHKSRSGKPLSMAEKTTLNACLDTVSLQLSLVLATSQDDTKTMILERVESHARQKASASG